MKFEKGDFVKCVHTKRDLLIKHPGAVVVEVAADNDHSWRFGHVKIMCIDGMSRWIHREGLELIHRSGMKDG